MGEKRKRGEDEDEDEGKGAEVKKVRRKGPKGPNPLSVKKPKKNPTEDGGSAKEKEKSEKSAVEGLPASEHGEALSDPAVKRKRKRKHTANKSAINGPVPEAGNGIDADVAEDDD